MLERISHKYLRQSLLIIVFLSMMTLLYIQLYGSDAMVVPLVVCAVFQLVTCFLYGKVWSKIATQSPDSLTILYLAASGLRMLTGLATVVAYCLLSHSNEAIRFFVILFLVFYLIILVYDTLFFVKVEKTLKKNG